MTPPAKLEELEFRTHERVSQIGASAWAELAGPDCPPFLRYEWISALEDSGCIDPDRGWLAMHLAAYQGGKLVAVAPCYVKGNSEGEFIFDHSFAHAKALEKPRRVIPGPLPSGLSQATRILPEGWTVRAGCR